MNFNTGKIGFLDKSWSRKSGEKFISVYIKVFSQPEDVKRGEDDVNIATAGCETGYTRMTAELNFAVQGIFDREDIAWIFFFTEETFFSHDFSLKFK